MYVARKFNCQCPVFRYPVSGIRYPVSGNESYFNFITDDEQIISTEQQMFVQQNAVLTQQMITTQPQVIHQVWEYTERELHWAAIIKGVGNINGGIYTGFNHCTMMKIANNKKLGIVWVRCPP